MAFSKEVTWVVFLGLKPGMLCSQASKILKAVTIRDAILKEL